MTIELPLPEGTMPARFAGEHLAAHTAEEIKTFLGVDGGSGGVAGAMLFIDPDDPPTLSDPVVAWGHFDPRDTPDGGLDLPAGSYFNRGIQRDPNDSDPGNRRWEPWSHLSTLPGDWILIGGDVDQFEPNHKTNPPTLRFGGSGSLAPDSWYMAVIQPPSDADPLTQISLDRNSLLISASPDVSAEAPDNRIELTRDAIEVSTRGNTASVSIVAEDPATITGQDDSQTWAVQNATAGTYILTDPDNGDWAALDWNADETAVQAAADGLYGASNSVVVDNLDGTYTITWGGDFARTRIGRMYATANTMTGPGDPPSVAVTAHTIGTPDGLPAPQGSMALGPDAIYRNTDGTATGWVALAEA